MANLNWGTRTQIASGTVGSDNIPNSSKYIYKLYGTATKNGTNASLYIEYTIQSGGQHYGQADPYWELWVDGTRRGTATKHDLYGDSEVVLGTYTKTLTADSAGHFPSTSIEGKWINNYDAGYCPNSLTISGTAYLPNLATYTVQYDSNGGSGTIANDTKVESINLTLPSGGFTKTGYHMTGWRKDSTSGDAYALGGSYTGNAAATFYAMWTLNEYYVRFNANGGTGSMSNETFTYGQSKALTANAFTKSGYRFAGWATSPDGDVVYTDGETVSNLTGEDSATVDLYAVWETSGVRVKHNGEWKTGIAYVKVNGEWTLGQVYAKNNGTWKAGE